MGAWGFVIAVIAACGGHVEGENDVKPCPTDMSRSSCSNNQRCALPTQGCRGTTTITCDCVNGDWACPDIGIACPPDDPPPPNQTCGDIGPGGFCSSPGQVCYSGLMPKCGNGPTRCTCTGGVWACDEPKCPKCPSPSAVIEGQSCGGSGPNSCQGIDSCGDPTLCFCMGPQWTWSCQSTQGCADGGFVDAKAD
jgi:hypothetical protein